MKNLKLSILIYLLIAGTAAAGVSQLKYTYGLAEIPFPVDMNQCSSVIIQWIDMYEGQEVNEIVSAHTHYGDKVLFSIFTWQEGDDPNFAYLKKLSTSPDLDVTIDRDGGQLLFAAHQLNIGVRYINILGRVEGRTDWRLCTIAVRIKDDHRPFFDLLAPLILE